MDCSMSGFPFFHYIQEVAVTHVHWVGDAIQLLHPLLPSYPPVLNHSQHQGLFQWVSSHIRWPKYWSFSFSISPSSEYSGSMSSRMDWLDLCAVLAANLEIFLFKQQRPDKDPSEPSSLSMPLLIGALWDIQLCTALHTYETLDIFMTPCFRTTPLRDRKRKSRLEHLSRARKERERALARTERQHAEGCRSFQSRDNWCFALVTDAGNGIGASQLPWVNLFI